MAADTRDEAGALASIDVTAGAVQTLYQRGVPHTDWTGSVRTAFEGGSSFFPRGMYYPEPCRTAHEFTWPAFEDKAHPHWQDFKKAGGTYQLFISLGTTPQDGDRLDLHSSTQSATTATVDLLPAETDLYYTVLPNPWLYFIFDPPLAKGTFRLACPPDDPDLPNVVKTLADGGFNLAFIKHPNHPQPFIDLKEAGQVSEFEFIVDARHPRFADIKGFTEQLFGPPPEGQGYSQHPDIYGWQLEDEHMLAISRGGLPCDQAKMQAALDWLRQKYEKHKDLTEQVIFHVAGSPTYFGFCDPGALWDKWVQIGDAANHDHYLSGETPTGQLQTLKPVADSVRRQTQAVSGQKPSWFTAQAFALGGSSFRTPQETRATIYTAIIHGATGIHYFMLDSFVARSGNMVGIRPTIPVSYDEQTSEFSPSPEVRKQGELAWKTISELNGELAQLQPFLLQPTDTEPYRVRIDQQRNDWSPIRTMLKSDGNEHYLIAVNIDNAVADAEFQFEHRLSGADVLFENRQASITGNGVNVVADRFEPFDVNIYRLSVSDSDSDSVDDFADNCLLNPNPDQMDQDGDGLGLACDPDDGLVDADRDGCSDPEELGPNQVRGGRRDATSFWDFFDLPVGQPAARDKRINVIDIGALLRRFGSRRSTPISQEGLVAEALTPPPPAPAYHTAFDRGSPISGQNAWNLRAPDGSINIVDLAALLAQFGHTCVAPP